MIGVTRLYLHLRDEVPHEMRDDDFPAVIDCDPSDVSRVKRHYQRRGLEVIALEL